jgi:TBC1 domain family member 14
LNRGEHHAAIEVARRLNSDLNDGKYVIYGVNEETLWQSIEEVEFWWKDSTWARLVQRELPDV